MDTSKKYFNPSPERNARFISKLFFCWVVPFFKYGYQNDLDVQDIYSAANCDVSGPLGNALERNWLKEIERASNNQERPSLKRAIFKTFFKSYSLFGVYIFIQVVVLRSLQPIVLAEYIRYFEKSTGNHIHVISGILLGLSVISLSFVFILIFHHCSVGCQRIGMRVRVACSSLVYRKLLKLSQSSLNKTAAGQVVNLLSNDVDRFELAANFLHYIWIMPLQVVAALFLMFNSVGVATLAGMITVSLEAVFLQGYLSRLQGKLRYEIALKTDYRIKLMSELVSGMQVIKMYAWEKPFEKIVETARKLEVGYITKTSYIKGFSAALAVVTERFTLYLTVITYALLGHRITGDIVFSMAQLFNTVQLYMIILFPNALSAYAEAKVTIKRLEDFLLLEENEAILTTPSTDIMENRRTGSIRISNVNASWIKSDTDTLRDIDLDINPGMLCCVVGSVGAGKSSLLHMILKEMYIKSGKLEVDGNLAYASQEPWLFVASVRDNILFGRPYLKIRYKNVIKFCALEKDFEQFPFGDKTLVGERGVSLSGGQRARINLARAVYADADIYLLDDPLSAVDTHVGKYLFEECIVKYLGEKTRILVTHQLQFLRQADIIIVINDGEIEDIGTYSQLSESVLSRIQQAKEETDKEHKEEFEKRERIQSISSVGSSISKEDTAPAEIQELIEKGSIPLSTYTEYWRSGANIFYLIFLLLLLVVAQMTCNSCDLWITRWTNAEEQRIVQKNPERNLMGSISPTVNGTEKSNITSATDSEPIRNVSKAYYITIYTLLITCAIFLTTIRSFIFYKFCMTASRVLHSKMFSNILRAPMRFFDITPSGRILNRFSKDMGAIDEILPQSMMGTVQVFLVMFGIVTMVLIVTPWMIVPTALLGYLFYKIRTIYLKSAQNVKRLEGVNRAPIFTHVSATFYGLSTIRAADAQSMVADEFDILQDQHTSTWYMFIICSEAFGLSMDVICTVFLAIVTLQFLIFNDESNFSGYVGLVISSSLILTGMLQIGVRQSADVASNMTSVERVLQYTKLEKEETEVPAKKTDLDWPHSGKIIFKNIYLWYVPEDPPVLKNLNITINQGEKIGIVGRTGAGKSTLITSLFRLAPIQGIITIDDVDTSTIALEKLRSNISIIPQEPVLFSATVRYNLDPFETVSDEILWKTLEDVELRSSIDSLDQLVSEGGSNFSAGQKQLICLARAIVRNNKILVMDEATANVDHLTDSLIQKTIRENFKHCTVLTIAHRLNTVMDSDKILVMDFGQAVEFAHAHDLLQKPDGYLTKMVKETGIEMEATLYKVAEEDYDRKFSDTIREELENAMRDEEL